MRFFDLKTILNLVLLVAIALLISFWPKHVDTSEPFKRAVHEKELVILEQSQIITKLAQKTKADSLQSIKTKQRYDSISKRQSAVISDLKRKPRVIEVIKQEPEVKALVEAQDSLINLQFQRIAVLEGLEHELRQDMSKVIISCEQRFQAQVEKFALAEQRIADLEKQNRKERRKGKLKGVLIPIAGAMMFLLGSQL
jgi:hypothetical protein